MKSGGWAKGRKETKLLRVDADVHKLALYIAVKMVLPIKSAVELAIKKMAKDQGIGVE